MSIFFKALEQAERERALREQGGESEATAPARPGAAAPVRPSPGAVPADAAAAPRVAAQDDGPRSRAAAEAPARPTAQPADVPRQRTARPIDATAEASAPAAAVRQEPEPPRATRPSRRISEPAPGWRAAAASSRAVDDLPVGEIDEHLVSLLQPMSPAAEQYRALRHVIDQLHRAEGLSVFAVCSPSVGDGKTTTAINLAGTLAQSPEAQVLLLEADLRQPAAAERLGMTGEPARGLVEALESPGLALDDIVRRRVPFDNLSVLLAGRIAAAPYEALESPRLAELLEEARTRFDYVVVDTPPILSVPDCRVISKWVDGFVIVVAAHRTPRKMLEEALNVMEPSKVIGLVFTRDDHSAAGYYAYGAYGARPNRASMAFAVGTRE